MTLIIVLIAMGAFVTGAMCGIAAEEWRCKRLVRKLARSGLAHGTPYLSSWLGDAAAATCVEPQEQEKHEYDLQASRDWAQAKNRMGFPPKVEVATGAPANASPPSWQKSQQIEVELKPNKTHTEVAEHFLKVSRPVPKVEHDEPDID